MGIIKNIVNDYENLIKIKITIPLDNGDIIKFEFRRDNMRKQNEKSVRLMKELKNIVLKQYPAQSGEIINRAFEINQRLCKENSNQSRKILKHKRNKIYPAISFYKAVLQITESKEGAYSLIADNFNRQAKNTNQSLRMLCKMPFSYKLVPLVMTKIIHNIFGKESGFDMIEYTSEKEKCHIDMTVCPYFSNCVEYGCLELGTAFCNSDDIAYGDMHPKLFWGRTKTLARGNECCDFILEIRK